MEHERARTSATRMREKGIGVISTHELGIGDPRRDIHLNPQPRRHLLSGQHTLPLEGRDEAGRPLAWRKVFHRHTPSAIGHQDPRVHMQARGYGQAGSRSRLRVLCRHDDTRGPLSMSSRIYPYRASLFFPYKKNTQHSFRAVSNARTNTGNHEVT